MKTLKKVMAALLAVVIVITGGAFAFAENTETVIEWEFDGETFESLYVGEATEGTFTIKAMEEYEDVYYTFDAEKAGYYTVTFDWYPVDYCIAAESYEDGKAYGFRESMINGEYGEAVALYYFDEGINYIGFNLYSSDSYDSYAEINFIGEEITNVIFDESEIENLIIDADIYEYEYEEGFYWYTDIELEFDSNKTITYYDSELCFDMKAPLEKGEVELTLNVFNYSKDYVVTAYEITDIISEIRIPEESSKEVEILYDGSINYEKLSDVTIEVTFTNGEKVTVSGDYGSVEIEFPFGKTYFLDVYYEDSSADEIYIVVVFPYGESKVFLREKCENIEADKDDNREALKENISYPFEITQLFFYFNISNLEYVNTIGQAISVIFNALGDAAVDTEWAFSNLFTQLITYITYSLSR